jgi:hypothetical protein
MARAKRGFLEKPEEFSGQINLHACFSRPMRGLHAVNLFSAWKLFYCGGRQPLAGLTI